MSIKCSSFDMFKALLEIFTKMKMGIILVFVFDNQFFLPGIGLSHETGANGRMRWLQ